MGISVVIATKGRVKLLIQLLESINKARENYEGECEVILIDDSAEKDRGEIEKACRRLDARVEHYSPSVAGKRNYGVRLAKYEIILFLDSDCAATPCLLKEHADKYINEKVGAVAGPLEFIGEENWFWKSVVLTPYLICFKMPYWGENSPWGTTANFSVRKDVFNKVGGFDENFPNKPGGEDVDLGLRITEMGYRIMNAPKGLVYHNKETWSAVKPMLRRAWYYGSADYYLIEKHSKIVTDAAPRRSMVFALIMILCVGMALLKTAKYLWGIPLWLLFDVCGMAICMSRFGYQKSSFLHQLVAQVIVLANEWGFVVNCLKHKKVKYCFKQMVYFDNQMKGITYNGNNYFWCFFLSYVLMLMIGITL